MSLEKTSDDNCYVRRVQYYETDKMGIVHHSNYIRYFEEARVDFLYGIGLAFDRIESLGYLSPVLSVNCDYVNSLRFGDEFCVKTSFVEFGNVKYRMAYEVFRLSDSCLCAKGGSVHCFTDISGNVISMKRENRELFDKFLEKVQNTGVEIIK